MKNTLLAIFVVLLLILTACGCFPIEPSVTEENPVEQPTDEPQEESTQETQPASDTAYLVSKVDRLTAPPLSDPVTTNQITGNNQFAFDLYQQLLADPELSTTNLFYSPYSISSALAMTYAGAHSETEIQMEETLNYRGQTDTHEAFNALNQYFEKLNAITAESEWEDFSLHINNALWGDQTYNIQSEYLDTLAKYYGAGYFATDFIYNPENSRMQINDWVSEKTNERIQDLLAPGTINSATRVVLTNTIYFIASWVNEFDEMNTRDEPFTLLDGSTVQVPTMMTNDQYLYSARDGYQMIELPYNGYQVSMFVILPEEGSFEQFESLLTAEKFSEMRESLTSESVDLYMPKFHAESSFSVNDMLASLGMTDAFDPDSADFSGISGSRDLFISNIIHKAIVDLDEEGTEAAAATAVIMELTSAMPVEETIELRLDSPFIYAIVNPESGSILFMGRMLNPQE